MRLVCAPEQTAFMLKLDRISKQFPGASQPVVQDISLWVEPGELLSLLGASGCGKTTLLRLIAGFEQPQSGTIDLDGQRVAGDHRWVPPERRDIGMVFQDYALFPHLTVADNLAFGLQKSHRNPAGLSPQQRQERVSEMLELVNLSGFGQRYPHELSGGQQQRVALARALAPKPRLILLDEPLSNLDVQVRLKLRQEIRTALKHIGCTAILVTHDQEEALSISDRVAVLRQGQIEQLGTPEELYQTPASSFIAEFVCQANLIPTQGQGKNWQTELGEFERPNPTLGEHSGVDGVLMLRQSDLTLHPDATSPFVICDRAFLGREHRYRVQLPSGTVLQVVMAQVPALAIGTRVRVSVTANPASLRVFPL
jgi:iron(III) transport system ATP-binding protein